MQSETTPTLEKEDIERIFLGFAVEAQKQMTDDLLVPRKKVIVLSGPTAAGKTDFSLKLAKEIQGEIVSADSMQVYRGMDIGTAKVPLAKRKEIPHHLIDIRNLSDNFNVVDFYYEARQCCSEIHRKEGVPIVVGGSGFYLHSFLYGPPSGPPSVPQLRKSLQEEMESLGIEALYDRLRKIDPQYASTITKNDQQKVIRALEIISLSGDKVSKLSWKGRKKPLNFDFRCWFLYRPKEKLYPRIERRCEEMLEDGLLEEVKKLEKLGIRDNTIASQAIGYRQALDYLKTNRTEKDYQHFVEFFKKTSRKFAKRQFTWFRREPLFRWLDLDMHDPEVARDMVRQDFEC
ncbi:MAG: tRNA (adenosine(37)-N6)-dimethylallyltransferase MiaA [Waddliaceae bacterium]